METEKLKELIIECSFYITLFASKKQYEKVDSYRKELNTLIDSLLKNKL